MNYQPFQHLYTHVKKGDPRLYEALDRISQNLQSLYSNSTQQVTSAGVASTLYLFATLTANTLISSPATPSNGTLLIVKLLQDGTGGRIITWDANFKTVPDLGNLDPNTYCCIVFIGDSGKWWVVSFTINQAQ